MARGPKKHLKRIFAPKHWMLDKLSGVWAPRPSTGPHKLRECLPLIILLRNRLRYALTYTEVKMIVMQRLVKVDGKVRTDMTYPAGLMDVVSIAKTNEHFRLLIDTKGRFTLHRIQDAEAKYKLCKVKKVELGSKAVPFIVTHDGRTIRYPHPDIKKNDTVRVNIEDGSVLDYVKFAPGNLILTTGGHNIGRVGILGHVEKHPGGFDIVHIKDIHGHEFVTRMNYIFIIGDKTTPHISLPKSKGLKLSNVDDRKIRMARIHGENHL